MGTSTKCLPCFSPVKVKMTSFPSRFSASNSSATTPSAGSPDTQACCSSYAAIANRSNVCPWHRHICFSASVPARSASMSPRAAADANRSMAYWILRRSSALTAGQQLEGSIHQSLGEGREAKSREARGRKGNEVGKARRQERQGGDVPEVEGWRPADALS